MAKLILITGGSASGKTHFAKMLKQTFGEKAVLLSQDNFYKPGKSENRNYDLPKALDFDKQKEVLDDLLNNKKTEIPVYDFTTSTVSKTQIVEPAEYILFEGLFVLYDYELAKKSDFKIFVDTPADTRLARRIIRDMKERGRDIEETIQRWMRDVQPSYIKYIDPMKKYSDIIVPWHKLNNKTLNLISQSIILLDRDAKTIIELLKK